VNGTSGTASAIAAGYLSSCAIQAGSGAVVCWGWAGYDATTPPDSVNGTSGTASAIAAGYLHGCAIQAGSGAVVCWGWNDDGQATPPDSVNGTSGIASAISVGSEHTLAIRSAFIVPALSSDTSRYGLAALLLLLGMAWLRARPPSRT
jgi:alpha-tubulin suppressor-like RCC1 family protein